MATRFLPALPAALTAAGLALSAQAQDLDPASVQQPEGAQLAGGDRDELIERGRELYADAGIGQSGTACTTCHADFMNYNDTFKEPYPHFVQMAKGRAGLDEVNAAEMVQLCMVVPMAAEPLAWDSPELAALTAYVEHEQEAFAAR